MHDLTKLWGTSFLGNATASMAVAACASSWLFYTEPLSSFACALAIKKCSFPFWTTMGKAVGANWLVNLAVFQAATSNSTGGKIAAVWMPVTAFVCLGLEHSVANMFLLPLGKWCGAELTWLDIISSNIVPVCIGNAIGAGIFVAGAQWFALGGARRRV